MCTIECLLEKIRGYTKLPGGRREAITQIQDDLIAGRHTLMEICSHNSEALDKRRKNIEIALENHRNTEPYRDDMTLLVSKFN